MKIWCIVGVLWCIFGVFLVFLYTPKLHQKYTKIHQKYTSYYTPPVATGLRFNPACSYENTKPSDTVKGGAWVHIHRG